VKNILIAMVTLALAMVPCLSHAGLQVVTTTQDLAALAKSVGGDLIEVESLTPGTRDPHYAVAKPSMIRKVHKADLLLVVGADLEIGWLPALLQSARNSQVHPGNSGYLDLSAAVPLLGVKTGPVSRAAGDVHVKGNPHYWLNPRNGILMAEAIARRLSELDPANAATYTNRSDAFKNELEQRIGLWLQEAGHLQGQTVIAYHKSFDYLAQFFGFDIVDEVEPKPGIAPSAATLSTLITRIEQEDIGLLIMEPYYERRSSRYLNKHTGIDVAVLPQSVGAADNVTSYIDLFDSIVAEFKSSKGN
jgi:zinc/manganese transport system substrate-binding protein